MVQTIMIIIIWNKGLRSLQEVSYNLADLLASETSLLTENLDESRMLLSLAAFSCKNSSEENCAAIP